MMFKFTSGFKATALVLLILLWLLAAGGCGSSQVADKRSGHDENLARLNRSARMAYDNGQLEQAADLYQHALDRAYLRDDREAIVDALYNIAACMLGLRSYDQALDRVHQAKSELQRGNQSASGDILIIEATLLFRSGQSEAAWRVTDEILSDPGKPSATVKNKTHYLRGLISEQRGDTAVLGREIGALSKSSDPGLRADRQELTGRLAMAEGRWDAAAEAFDQTVRLRREKLDYVQMAQALALAAGACQKAGKYSEAAMRYFRAGRSAARQGNNQDAIEWLSNAAGSASQAGDEALEQEITALLESIQDR